MNLCGGIVNTTESEMLIPSVLTSGSSDEEVDVSTPRMKMSTPRRRRREGSAVFDVGLRTPSSRSKSRQSSSVPTPSSPLLNPLSKEDLQKSRARQRPLCGPLNSLKTSSIVIKKLEAGFRVVLHTDESSLGGKVSLDLDQDRSNLRMRPLESVLGKKSGSDSAEPEVSEKKLKVKDILRLQVGKTKSAGKSSSTSGNVQPAKCFSIVMKKTEGSSCLDFEAESLVDRDAIISALRALLDQGKASLDLRKGKSPHKPDIQNSRIFTDHDHDRDRDCPSGSLSPMKRTHIHSGTPSSQHSTGGHSRTPRTPGDQGTETSLAYFSFNTTADTDAERAKESGLPKKNIALPSLNEVGNSNGASFKIGVRKTKAGLPSDLLPPDSFKGSSENASQRSSDDDVRDNSFSAAEGDDIRDKHAASSDGESNGEDTTRGKSSNRLEADEVRELAVTIIESDSMRDGSVEVTGSEWSDSDEWSGSRIKSKSRRRGDAFRPARTPRREKTLSRRPDALANVDDVELMSLANQMAEPWCTDDICTAALKDVADACKGVFDMKQRVGTGKKHAQNDSQREIVEDYIAGVLGAPSAMVSFLAVGDVWNSTVTPDSEESPEKAEVNRIQNRASVLNAQARRIQRLRSEMTFIAARKNDTERLHYVQTIKSYDDVARKNDNRVSEEADLVDQFDSSALLQQVVGNMVGQESAGDDEILYYDSDPEDTRVRTLNKGPRRVYADRLNAVETNTSRRKILSGIPMNRLSSGRRWKKMDEGVCTEIIEAMKNEKMTLMWHPTQTKQFPNRRPVCVKVWIESGVYLIDGTFLLPKLTWIPMYERHLHSKLLNVSNECPDRIDLLDVCRVRECERVDRRLHPFARADRSFIIQTQSEVFLFETQSREERGRVVNGLKLVIARLASLLMLRDLRAVEEFFGGGGVPGEAPAWAQGTKGDNASAGDDFNE